LSSDPASPAYADDADLGYLASRTRFAPGEPLRLDQAYRLAHLPLLRPDHPAAIREAEGRLYLDGVHDRRWSVVLPVDADALEASPAMRGLEAALRVAPFAAKIAWDLLPRRRAILHATVCGGLGAGPAPHLDAERLAALATVGPFEVELRGLFSGNVNIGRLYLRTYPELRPDGTDALRAVQCALGRPVTDLWVVGLWNLLDDLDPTEAAALAGLIDEWWDVPLLRFTATELWLLGARDDLVLDGDPPIPQPLGRAAGGLRARR
jgi:hypothetical protein